MRDKSQWYSCLINTAHHKPDLPSHPSISDSETVGFSKSLSSYLFVSLYISPPSALHPRKSKCPLTYLMRNHTMGDFYPREHLAMSREFLVVATEGVGIRSSLCPLPPFNKTSTQKLLSDQAWSLVPKLNFLWRS